MPSILNSLLQHSAANGSRSTALKPLGWLVGLLIIGTIASMRVASPEWLIKTFAWLSGGSVVLYGVAYIYFMFKDPDALRSERFNIEKMAIQKGLVGDSESGLLDVDHLVGTSTGSVSSSQLEDMR